VANTDNDLAQVETKLAARLTSGLSGLYEAFTADLVKWPGQPFTTPSSKWMRFSLSGVGVVDQDASGSYELNRGFCTISVFYPRGKYDSSFKALSVAKTVKSLYTSEKFDDLVIEQVSVSPSPEPDGSNWFGVNVTIQFSYQGFTS
jgi:hypothetical protein